jgi:hypothetical protein
MPQPPLHPENSAQIREIIISIARILPPAIIAILHLCSLTNLHVSFDLILEQNEIVLCDFYLIKGKN